MQLCRWRCFANQSLRKVQDVEIELQFGKHLEALLYATGDSIGVWLKGPVEGLEAKRNTTTCDNEPIDIPPKWPQQLQYVFRIAGGETVNLYYNCLELSIRIV
ncbi:hypothetical protein MSC49_40490 (plasmid) [Methylosinus sp. C49]|nr:hypothetical protein MSC49_40490 [Methylosinus sp. C49]